MFMLNFKFLLFLSVFVGFLPSTTSAQQPIVAPAPNAVQSDLFVNDELTIKKQNGDELPFNIELALTPPQQAQGLMYRTKLADNAGMLFVFGQEAPRSFWMKNTLIPLDMIFIKRSGIILNIHSNAIPQDLTPIASQGNAYAVLEIAGGLGEKLNIQAGDRISHSSFSTVILK